MDDDLHNAEAWEVGRTDHNGKGRLVEVVVLGFEKGQGPLVLLVAVDFDVREPG